MTDKYPIIGSSDSEEAIERAIWKFPIDLAAETQVVVMPQGAIPIEVAWQGSSQLGQIYIWAS